MHSDLTHYFTTHLLNMANCKKDLSHKISKIDKDVNFLQDSIICEEIIKEALIQEKNTKKRGLNRASNRTMTRHTVKRLVKVICIFLLNIIIIKKITFIRLLICPANNFSTILFQEYS